MEEKRLVLKDGTVKMGASASRSSDDRLMVRVPGDDLLGCTLLFADPEKTQEIVCYSSIYKYTFTGYTRAFSIQHFSNENYIEIWLKGEEGKTSHTREITVPEIYVPMEV